VLSKVTTFSQLTAWTVADEEATNCRNADLAMRAFVYFHSALLPRLIAQFFNTLFAMEK